MTYFRYSNKVQQEWPISYLIGQSKTMTGWY